MSKQASATLCSRARTQLRGGRADNLLLDARGGVAVEYLAIVSGIALGLVALAYALRDTYANGFIARSLAVLGVQP